MNRRRFLMVAAAAIGAGVTRARAARADRVHWRGRALGAEAEITLIGPTDAAERALGAARAAMERAEAAFSLFQEGSAIRRLNKTGQLNPSPEFTALMALSARLYRVTEGRFDPTVQPLWAALAAGQSVAHARQVVGWDQVRLGPPIQLGEGQALTLNGIAQGFATDMVSAALAAEGFDETLVNIGEFRSGKGTWRVGISDPEAGLFRHFQLKGAVATSSPHALQVGGEAHILSPQGSAPIWSTVSVEASEAAIADGLSTAFCLMDRHEIRAALTAIPEVTRVTLVDGKGDIETILSV